VTDSTVLTQTAGLGLPAKTVAANMKTATAPDAASAIFLPPSRRLPGGEILKRAFSGSGVCGVTRSSSAARRSSKSGPS